ncbi:protein SSUH2 homolog isoform X2 [Pimephales promelas]|uniref:protein SSUH2 homolog isoform X2 n=1 Tax=Pimephales promelas TaxID=90988 RepID=UPI0019556D25|nr:protein SSUH2 homolog isoform X2 [Pimephales promelas]
MFDSIPGYEGTSGDGGVYLPPPMPSVLMPVPEASSHPEWHGNIPSISEERAHEAFEDYVSSKCCYRSGPVRDGVITNMESFNTYRYRLETFTESRSTKLSQEPYRGQHADAGIQRAPEPWEIAAQPPSYFTEHKETIRVPYTSSVKKCDPCSGMGKTPCVFCIGSGSKVCSWCNGSGQCPDGACYACGSSGRERCSSCGGIGFHICNTCDGNGQLLVFINLIVEWSTERDEYVGEDSSGLKQEKLGKVSGKELFRDGQIMVSPVLGFPDVSVAQASERIIRDHRVKYTNNSRILQQRQTIELITITRVNYTWKEKPYVYYVYGNELKVNAEDYPATCCCSVM